MIAFWVGTTLGTFGGLMLGGILAAGRCADLEAEREHWERMAHRQTLKRIMADVWRTKPDQGRELLDDISDAYTQAERPWRGVEGWGA